MLRAAARRVKAPPDVLREVVKRPLWMAAAIFAAANGTIADSFVVTLA
jgi:hypothetical protein